jgi:hypothetical protein
LNSERLQSDCEPAGIWGQSEVTRARRRRKIESQDEFASVSIHEGGGNYHFHSSFTPDQPQGADEAAIRRNQYGLRVKPLTGRKENTDFEDE